MIISMAKVMVCLTPKFSPEGYLELMARMEIEYGVLYLFQAHISVWRQMKK